MHCGGKLKDYEFYEKLKVYDEMGQPHEIDLSKPGTPACMLRYDEDEDGDKLQQADILSIYLPPKDKGGIRRPHIEHGYLWEWEDLVEDDDCKTFVECSTKPLADKELVNSTGIYNSPAEHLECCIRVVRSAQQLTGGADDEYFWTRVIDLESGAECSVDDIEKPLRGASPAHTSGEPRSTVC